ncbi:MAG: TetR/AcrR family transcriptional regulator [Bacteroidota bacterium]
MKSTIKEQRLAHIIDSAEEVFFEKGFSKTSISDICKVASCSRTTLYSYFENKENIYLAVVNKSFQQFLKHFFDLKISSGTGLQRILALAQGYLDFSKQSPKEYQMVLDFYTILKNSQDKVLQSESYALLQKCTYFTIVQENAQLPLQQMIHVIEYGQKDGSIRNNTAAESLFFNIWAYLIGVTNLSNNRNTIRILGVQMQDWEDNTLLTIEQLLSK